MVLKESASCHARNLSLYALICLNEANINLRDRSATTGFQIGFAVSRSEIQIHQQTLTEANNLKRI